MSHLRTFLLLPSLCATLTLATDINTTNEILNNAIKATETLQIEMDKIIDPLSSNDQNITEAQEESITGDVIAGKNIFKYVLKEDCKMNAYQFASKFSQEEWEEIAEKNTIKATIFKFCPNTQSYYQDKWTNDLYQFLHDNANEEDGIPEC